MGALANYKSYSYLKYSIYTNKVIPIGLYAVGAAAFILVMIFSTVYTWRKVKERKYLRRTAAGGSVGELKSQKGDL